MARLTSRLTAVSSVHRACVSEILRCLNDRWTSQSAGYCRQNRECAMGGRAGTSNAMRSNCVFSMRGREKNAACAEETKHVTATATITASTLADRNILLFPET